MSIRPRRYEGEDTRPTSSKEIRGFYVYSWAAEVFVVCGIGTLPGSQLLSIN